jgi:hypothetical protein
LVFFIRGSGGSVSEEECDEIAVVHGYMLCYHDGQAKTGFLQSFNLRGAWDR